jgi:glycosyltransferase involved in cell wall biosynthesis
MTAKLSIIIPAYNEESCIENCLKSLEKQTYKNREIIVIDDGSTDKTLEIIKNYQILILHQDHKGPGVARNLGAKHSEGEMLVFVDADMTFEENFLDELTKPIREGKTIGTFSKSEFVSNKENIWSICWNINRNVPKEKMLPNDYPQTAPVFRAILKKEFNKVKGFSTNGEYTDDWSLSRKLEVFSTNAPKAIYYHQNPSTLNEVYCQAKWIGKSEFISGSILVILRSIIIYNPISSLINALIKSVLTFNPNFFIFKLVYDTAIFVSVINSSKERSKAK